MPAGSDVARFATGLGLQLIAIGLHFSPRMRDILANRAFLWLGKQSFAVYLLHGPLLRSVLAWMVYGFKTHADTIDKDGIPVPHYTHFPGFLHLYVVLVLWIPLNYAAAVAWTTYVDPFCSRVTERMVGYVMREETEKSASVLPV